MGVKEVRREESFDEASLEEIEFDEGVFDGLASTEE